MNRATVCLRDDGRMACYELSYKQKQFGSCRVAKHGNPTQEHLISIRKQIRNRCLRRKCRAVDPQVCLRASQATIEATTPSRELLHGKTTSARGKQIPDTLPSQRSTAQNQGRNRVTIGVLSCQAVHSLANQRQVAMVRLGANSQKIQIHTCLLVL